MTNPIHADYPSFDPDELERRIPGTALGTIRSEDLEAAAHSWAPGLEAYFWDWGRGITVTEAGIPLSDWRHFLAHLRANREDQARAERYLEAWQGRAQEEGWPSSDLLATRLGMTRAEVRKARVAGQVLGVWFKYEGDYRYPPFQFAPNGRPRTHLPALLSAMAENPLMAPAADAHGWARLSWLYAPRMSLSIRSLADEAAPDGIARDSDSLSGEARTPAELFSLKPTAVIALAHHDAAEVRGD